MSTRTPPSGPETAALTQSRGAARPEPATQTAELDPCERLVQLARRLPQLPPPRRLLLRLRRALAADASR